MIKLGSLLSLAVVTFLVSTEARALSCAPVLTEVVIECSAARVCRPVVAVERRMTGFTCGSIPYRVTTEFDQGFADEIANAINPPDIRQGRFTVEIPNRCFTWHHQAGAKESCMWSRLIPTPTSLEPEEMHRRLQQVVLTAKVRFYLGLLLPHVISILLLAAVAWWKWRILAVVGLVFSSASTLLTVMRGGLWIPLWASFEFLAFGMYAATFFVLVVRAWRSRSRPRSP